jgi:hypothetical protein
MRGDKVLSTSRGKTSEQKREDTQTVTRPDQPRNQTLYDKRRENAQDNLQLLVAVCINPANTCT